MEVERLEWCRQPSSHPFGVRRLWTQDTGVKVRERGGVQGQDDETAHGAAGYIYWGELAPRKHQNTFEGPGRGVVVVNAAGIDTGCCATTLPRPPPTASRRPSRVSREVLARVGPSAMGTTHRGGPSGLFSSRW